MGGAMAPLAPPASPAPESLFRVATLNVGTTRVRSSKVVERTFRSIDPCCMQSPLERFFCQIHNKKRSRYRFFWVGNHAGTDALV